MSEYLIQMGNFPAISWEEKCTFRCDDVHFVLDQHASLDLYSAFNNSIGGVIVSMLAASVVDRGIESRLAQTTG
jgi:hypothetical protein